MEANNAETLVRYIKWASTAVLKAASSPASQIGTPATSVVSNPTATTLTPVATSVPAATGAVPIPAVPTSNSDDDDVW